MKKISRILALSLAIVMILSGCGAQTQKPAKTEEPTPQPSQTTPATTTPSTQPAQTTPTEPKTDDTQSAPAMSLGTKEYSFENVSSAVFNTKLEGDSVAATSEVVNGAYRISASKTDGESWHLKLESTLATNPGSTYRVTFDFDSDTAGTVKFGDNQSFTIDKGKNTVTGTFKADGDNKYIDLQLGALEPFVLDLYEIKVEEYAPDGSGSTATLGGALRETVTEQHDGGYEVHLTATETGAKMNIAAAPASDRGVWKAKMLINTGEALEAGKTYRVSLNVGAEKSQSEYEVCFDGTSENAYGALYGRSLTAGVTDRIEYLVTPERSAGELVLRLQLGKTNSASGNVISVSGLKVEEVNISYRSVTPAITYGTFEAVSEQHADTFTQRLERNSDSAVLRIDAVPEKGEVYESKLLIHTGVTPEAGKSYAVSFSVASAKETEYEISYNKASEEKGYGAQYGEKLASGEKKTIEYTVAGTDGKGELTIQLMLGKSPAENAVTVSDVKVCEITEKGNVSVLPGAINYTSVGNITSWLFDGYEASLENTDGSASMTVEKTAEVREVWMAKLLADTGVVPEAGRSYRATFTVETNKALEYELCYNMGDVEKGYDVLYGQSLAANAKKTVERIITGASDDNGRLVIQLSVGNAAEGTKVTISDIKVEELTSEYTDILPESFSFNSVITEMRTGVSRTVVPGASVLPTSFKYDKVTVKAEQGEGLEQTLSTDGTSATLTITKAPDGTGKVWASKLFVYTGFIPEPDTDYRVYATVGATGNTGAYEMLVKNEPGGQYEGKYGINQLGTLSAGFHTPVSESDCGEITVLFQFGNTENGNVITVSNIRVVKVTGTTDVTPSFTYPNTVAETLSASFNAWDESSAELQDSGSSDTVKFKINAPRSGGGVWSIHLFVGNGQTLEANTQYLVSADISAENAIENFAVLFSNGAVQAEAGSNNDGSGYAGGEFGLSISAGATKTIRKVFTAPDLADKRPLFFRFQLGNSPINTITVSNIKVVKVENSWNNAFGIEGNEGTRAALTGNGTSASANIVSVHSEPQDWHIKFYAVPGYQITESKTYKVSFDAAGATGGYACYKRVSDGAEEGFGRVNISSAGTIEHVITPNVTSNVEILMKLGTLAEGSEMTVSNIKIEEFNETDVLPSGFALSDGGHFSVWADNGYEVRLTGGESAASLEVKAVPASRSEWQIKQFVNTGVTLVSGKSYRVSALVECGAAKKQSFDIRYNGSAESSFGELKNISTGGTATFVIDAKETHNLELQLCLGRTDTPCSYTISDIKVEEITYETYYFTYTADVNGPITAWAHEDYKVALTGAEDGATLAITRLPEDGREPWKVKYFVDTLVKPQAGESYRVKLDVLSKTEQPFEICYNNNGEEKGYGAQYGLTAPAGENKTYEKIITIPDNVGYADNLILQLSLGNATAENEITVSNLVVEKIGFTGGTDALTKPISYVTGSSLDFWAHEDYEASVAGTGSAAVVNVKKAAENAEPWKIKLFVATGASLEAGKSYRVSASVASEKAQGFELCFNNGAAEAGYGALYGLKAGEKSTVGGLITVPADMENASDLVLQFNLGNSMSGSAITVSDIKVESVELAEGENMLPEAFSFASKSNVNGWAHEDYAVNLTDNGTSATMNITSVPAAGREAWKVKMFVETGTHLTAGKTYRVRMDVSAQSTVNYEICYNNGAVEKGVGALYDLRAGVNKSTVTATLTPNANSELIIQLSLGKAAGANAVTVSNVRVEELVTGGAKSVLPAEFKYVAAKEIDYQTAEPTAVSSILFPQSVVWMYNAEGSASGTMSTAGGKITYNMTKISKSDGENKITIPDVELKAGKTYTVTFKAKADKNIDCVFVLNRAGEWNTAIYENLGVGTEEKEYTFTTNALDADSAYELLWQFGSSKNNKLRTAEVEIRDVAIYSK